MLKTIANNETFIKACTDFFKIDDVKDLVKNKLTLNEYAVVYGLLKDMHDEKDSVTTLHKAIADWFAERNFKVKEDGICWIISL